MIIVEGPDGGGKTTLIERLKNWDLTLEVAPRVVSKDTQAMVDLKAWTEQNVTQGFQRVIFDRHRLFSEPIYGPLLRDEFQPGFDDPGWFAYHLAMLYKLNPVIIYCLPPLETVLGNLQDDPDNKAVVAFAREIYGAYYNKATTEFVLRDFTYMFDFTAEDADDQLDMILTGITTRIAMTEEI